MMLVLTHIEKNTLTVVLHTLKAIETLFDFLCIPMNPFNPSCHTPHPTTEKLIYGK
jgi:hypothetical protein